MGFGIIARTRGKLSAIDYGVCRTGKDDTLTERLVMLRTFLCRLLEHHNPDVVALEQVFMRKNVQSALRVGEARAMVLLGVGERGLPVIEYPTATAKRAVSGHGGATKEHIQVMVRDQLGLSEIPEPHDAADALALAICLLHDPRLDPRYPKNVTFPGRLIMPSRTAP
jgi:crossover junction endodeoxyribonuclease RuvC